MTDFVSILSGQRLHLTDRRWNANYERIEAGLQVAIDEYAPVLITGHGEESEELRIEFNPILRNFRRKLREEARKKQDAGLHWASLRDIEFDDRAWHTVGNAYVTCLRVRERFVHRRPRQPITVVVVTSAWHLPRTKLTFQGVRSALLEKSPWVWRKLENCEFEFHGAEPQTDPAFTRRREAEEKVKIQQVDQHIARLRELGPAQIRAELLCRPPRSQPQLSRSGLVLV